MRCIVILFAPILANAAILTTLAHRRHRLRRPAPAAPGHGLVLSIPARPTPIVVAPIARRPIPAFAAQPAPIARPVVGALGVEVCDGSR